MKYEVELDTQIRCSAISWQIDGFIQCKIEDPQHKVAYPASGKQKQQSFTL